MEDNNQPMNPVYDGHYQPLAMVYTKNNYLGILCHHLISIPNICQPLSSSINQYCQPSLSSIILNHYVLIIICDRLLIIEHHF